MTKKLLFVLLFFGFFVIGNAQQHIKLSKTKKNGKEKIKTIELNQKVKVYYVSKEKLSTADRPPFAIYKKKRGDNYVGLADGKLVEINKEYLLVQRAITKDLITIPVKNIIGIGNYNSFKRIGSLLTISLGTIFALDRVFVNQFGEGYDELSFIMSYLIIGGTSLSLIDSAIFPAHKLKPRDMGYSLSIEL